MKTDGFEYPSHIDPVLGSKTSLYKSLSSGESFQSLPGDGQSSAYSTAQSTNSSAKNIAQRSKICGKFLKKLRRVQHHMQLKHRLYTNATIHFEKNVRRNYVMGAHGFNSLTNYITDEKNPSLTVLYPPRQFKNYPTPKLFAQVKNRNYPFDCTRTFEHAEGLKKNGIQFREYYDSDRTQPQTERSYVRRPDPPTGYNQTYYNEEQYSDFHSPRKFSPSNVQRYYYIHRDEKRNIPTDPVEYEVIENTGPLEANNCCSQSPLRLLEGHEENPPHPGQEQRVEITQQYSYANANSCSLEKLPRCNSPAPHSVEGTFGQPVSPIAPKPIKTPKETKKVKIAKSTRITLVAKPKTSYHNENNRRQATTSARQPVKNPLKSTVHSASAHCQSPYQHKEWTPDYILGRKMQPRRQLYHCYHDSL